MPAQAMKHSSLRDKFPLLVLRPACWSTTFSIGLVWAIFILCEYWQLWEKDYQLLSWFTRTSDVVSLIRTAIAVIQDFAQDPQASGGLWEHGIRESQDLLQKLGEYPSEDTDWRVQVKDTAIFKTFKGVSEDVKEGIGCCCGQAWNACWATCPRSSQESFVTNDKGPPAEVAISILKDLVKSPRHLQQSRATSIISGHFTRLCLRPIHEGEEQSA